MDGIDVKGDLLAGVPVLNPLIMTQTYQDPVHKISPEYLPDTPPPEGPTYLLVYRRKDDEVGFLEVNTVSARLIDCRQANDDNTALQLFERIAE